MLHILGRAVDVAFVDGRMISPTLIEDTLCRVTRVRYASVVIEPDLNRRIALVLACLGATIDERACLDVVAAELGEEVAASLILIPARSFH